MVLRSEKMISRCLLEMGNQYPLNVELHILITTYLRYMYAAGVDEGRRKEELGQYNKKEKSKAVARLSRDNKILQSYTSITMAAKQMGVGKSSIYKAIKGINKTCKGYSWAYK